MTESVGWLGKTRKGTGLVLQLYFNAERFYIFPDDKATANLFDYNGRVMKIVDDKWIQCGSADKETERKTFTIDIENKRYVAYNLRKLLDDALDYLPVFGD